MIITSATGGPLQPTSALPLDDAALVDYIQAWLVGLIGNRIPGTLFFPRWQLDPPNYPGPTIDWASLGVEVTPMQLFPVVRHFDGYDQEETHEWIDLILSFYGPNCNSIARQLRDSIYIPQNLAPLYAQEIRLTETGAIRTAPSLIKERWQYRVDFSVKLRREIVRTYEVENIETVNVTVNNEFYTFTVLTTRPNGDGLTNEGFDTVRIVATVT